MVWQLGVSPEARPRTPTPLTPGRTRIRTLRGGTLMFSDIHSLPSHIWFWRGEPRSSTLVMFDSGTRRELRCGRAHQLGGPRCRSNAMRAHLKFHCWNQMAIPQTRRAESDHGARRELRCGRAQQLGGPRCRSNEMRAHLKFHCWNQMAIPQTRRAESAPWNTPRVALW